MPRRDLHSSATLGIKLGVRMLKRLDGLELMDRISPGVQLNTSYTIDGIRYEITAKVAARGVQS
jgi:hypothetical protein